MKNNWYSTNLSHFLHWREDVTAGERKKTCKGQGNHLEKMTWKWKRNNSTTGKYLWKNKGNITVTYWRHSWKSSQIFQSICFSGTKLENDNRYLTIIYIFYSSFHVSHKVDNIDTFIQLLIEINRKQITTSSGSMQI